jgi:hypothetical protein
VRSVVYDMLRGLKADSPEMAQMRLYMPDGLHPEWFGHLVWADVMIYTFKRLAVECMGDALLDVLAPGVRSPRSAEAPPHPRDDGLASPLPKAFHDYWVTLATRGGADGLPPPLLPGNGEDSDGFCYMAEKLPALVKAPHDGWSWLDESRHTAAGRHKWGYVTNTSGSKLRIQIDTTIGGLLQDPGKPRPPRASPPPPRPWSQIDTLTQDALLLQAKEHGNLPGQAQTSGGIKQVVDTHAEAMLGYLCTYENIGKAKVACVGGCSCEPAEMDGIWGQHYSTTCFLYMNVSAHEACTIEVESLEGKFKVEGVIVNARPYYWDTTATATHYTFMVTDLLNHMN